MDFIDKNAESVLIQQQLTELPRHVLSLVLTRDDVHASALTKFNAALAWSRAQLRKDPNQDLAEIFSPFVDVIQFDAIPASVLMREVKPMSLVPDNIIMGALAYQADPESIPPPNPGSRRPSGRNLCTTDEESIGSTTDLQEEMNKLSVKIDSDNWGLVGGVMCRRGGSIVKEPIGKLMNVNQKLKVNQACHRACKNYDLFHGMVGPPIITHV